MSSATMPADLSAVDITLPHAVSSVAVARRRLARYLTRARVADAVGDDAQLVLSELLSNAVRYAPPLPGGGVRVAWWLDKSGVHLKVIDGRGQSEPRVTEADPDAPGGRGLAIVTALTAQWSVQCTEQECSVYAVVPC